MNPVRLSRELEWNRGAKPDSLPRAEYLKKDIGELVECDRLVSIPGFEKSAGAMLEINIALALGVVVERIREEHFNSVLAECRRKNWEKSSAEIVKKGESEK